MIAIVVNYFYIVLSLVNFTSLAIFHTIMVPRIYIGLLWSCKQVHTHRYIRTGTYAQVHTCRYIRAGTYVQVHTCRYIRAGTYVQVHTCRYIRAGTYVQVHPCMSTFGELMCQHFTCQLRVNLLSQHPSTSQHSEWWVRDQDFRTFPKYLKGVL